MRLHRLPHRRIATGLCLVVLVACLMAAAPLRALDGKNSSSQLSSSQGNLIALVGGTVVDLSNWGRSAHDLHDAVVILRDGRIAEVGPRSAITIPKNARIIDCTGKFLVPGYIDGYAGMSTQGQANANLYMGVTTVVAASDAQRGPVYMAANPSPHIYLIDSAGTTDNWSLLARLPEWSTLLYKGQRSSELTPDDTARQLEATAKLGTRVIRIGSNITAANSQWVINRAHQQGLVTYGIFVATPYRVGIEAGVDALPFIANYDLGSIPNELQRPLVEDPEGTAADTAFDYAERIPPNDRRLLDYAKLLGTRHTVLIPAFSTFYLQLPGHRNLWLEPAARLLDAAHLSTPPDPQTGELVYPLSPWTRRLPAFTQRYLEDNLRKKAELTARRLWSINQTIFRAEPHYLVATDAPIGGTMPGISVHTEMELLVRLGLSPREVVAAATNNYSLAFGWNELGAILPGRRADILLLDADPTENIWNARRFSTLILDGNIIERDSLLNLKK